MLPVEKVPLKSPGQNSTKTAEKKEHLLNDRRQSSHETTIILVYHITAYSKDSGADEKIHRDIEISKLRLEG